MRLEINYKKKKTAKNTNMWRLNNMLLNNGSLKKSRRNFKNTWRQMKQKHNDPKSMGFSKSSPKREVVAIKAYLGKQEISQKT